VTDSVSLAILLSVLFACFATILFAIAYILRNSESTISGVRRYRFACGMCILAGCFVLLVGALVLFFALPYVGKDPPRDNHEQRNARGNYMAASLGSGRFVFGRELALLTGDCQSEYNNANDIRAPHGRYFGSGYPRVY
jgi:hypothetical protein